MKEDLTIINGPIVRYAPEARYVPRMTWKRTNFGCHTTQKQFVSSITPDGNGKVKVRSWRRFSGLPLAGIPDAEVTFTDPTDAIKYVEGHVQPGEEL